MISVPTPEMIYTLPALCPVITAQGNVVRQASSTQRRASSIQHLNEAPGRTGLEHLALWLICSEAYATLDTNTPALHYSNNTISTMAAPPT
jgi:hypothetical protein